MMSGKEPMGTPGENAPGKKGVARPIPNARARAGPVPPGLIWTVYTVSRVGRIRPKSQLTADGKSDGRSFKRGRCLVSPRGEESTEREQRRNEVQSVVPLVQR